MTPPLCLSVRQPWAWAILNGKDVENRDWSTTRRGRFLLHASKKCTVSDWAEAVCDIARIQPALSAPDIEDLDRGGIVAAFDIVDCVSESTSPWFVGKFGFVIANVKPLPFTPCKGQLGFFRCPDDAWKSLIEWKRQQPEASR
jgi:ASCH domain.